MTVLSGVEDVVLRDGSTMRFRVPTLADEAELIELLEGLSVDSRYLRFHGSTRITPATVASALETDWATRGSLLGERMADGRLRPVALATYVRLRDPLRAEVAFAVADEFHALGIGTRLLERLAAHAAASGIAELVADVLPQNLAMLRVLENAGFELTRSAQLGVVELSLRLDSQTARVVAARDERDHVAVVASLRPFFEPRSLAVVGASARRGTIGGELFRNVLAADFTGAAYPVNREGAPVGGVPAYPDIADVPEPVDLVVICVPGAAVLDAARAALDTGTKALCVISAGFAEIGEEGRGRQAELLALVRAHGARLVGPNCLGIASSPVHLNATFARRSLPPGRLAFSSQSGALGLALLEQADARGLGLSSFVSIGNKADVSSNDLLEYWEDDEASDAVLLYLESFGNPRKFARVASRVARVKPILAMRSGTSSAGARAASSHTAALAGSDRAVDALFWQSGVTRARTLEELLDAAVLVSTQPSPRGNRVAVLTNAGGLGILCADACEGAGLELPALADETVMRLRELIPSEASTANPIDILGSATERTFEAVLPPLLADPGIDAVISIFVPPVVATAADVTAAIARASAGATKPLLSVVLSADGTPVGSFSYPESAARALGLAVQRAAWLRRPVSTLPPLEGIDRDAATALVRAAQESADDLWLDPHDARALLAAYGLPLVEERYAETEDDAVAAAAAIGYPVVVKTAAPGAHKTESGGVHVDLRDAETVRSAVASIGGPVVVQAFVTGGVELLAGAVQDPVFGPLIAFGPGGIHAELIGEARVALAPAGDVEVDELLTGGKVGKLVAGWRGAPPVDQEPLADLLHRLGRLVDDLPAVAELDLNPVIAGPEGCVAVDARIRIRTPETDDSAKTW